MTKKQFKNLGRGSEETKKGVDFLLIKDNTKKEESSPQVVVSEKEEKAKGVQSVIKKAEKPTTEVKKKPAARPKQIKKEDLPIELPDDFKSHSCLFSADQLDKLRTVVYLKKATGDRKYSIKDAVYEAFNMLLESGRGAEDTYPDDFITYTPLISMDQFEKVNSYVYTIKAKEDKGYGMKYAVYEALELFLRANK